jgi:hypothetical protein
MEFVVHNVWFNGNRPPQSKYSLLKMWPPFEIARDVAYFLGFLNFYLMCIPYFKQRVAPLRPLASLEMDANVSDPMTKKWHRARADMISAIVEDPCIAHYDFRKRPFLLTDFSKLGFGYKSVPT